MIWSDCYATMALAAVNTKRIQIGTGVSIPGIRIAPVTAHSIASINQLAPGRVFLGIGTGHTAMRMMGQHPMPVSEFREYLRVVRKLLDGEAVDYTYRGQTREIKFIHRDRYFVNLDNRIPIYVAANGPKACQATGAYGDGWITVGGREEEVAPKMAQIEAGARAVGRKLPKPFVTACLIAGCVLRPGERITSERVIDEAGAWAVAELHFFYEVWKDLGEKDEVIPLHVRNIWDAYLKRVKSFSLPENARFRQIHDGHCTFVQPEERKFITPELLDGAWLIGTPEEIIEKIRAMEKAGMREVTLLPNADRARKVLRDFAEMIIPAFR